MNKRRRSWLISAGLGLTLVGGCQTWQPESGLTLPTGRYLQHTPQYIPPSPSFPLQRELSSMEEAAAGQAAARQPRQ